MVVLRHSRYSIYVNICGKDQPLLKKNAKMVDFRNIVLSLRYKGKQFI